MRNTIKTLALTAAMVAMATLSLPAKADAQYHYRHGYGHGLYGLYGHYGHRYYRHGYGSYGRYGHSDYGSYGHGASRYSNNGTVRIEVNPKKSRGEIEVHVDEAHAGVVDDFDGVFQRLYLPAGKHEVEIRLAGYQTLRMAIFVSPGNTYHIRGQMEPLVAD